MIKHRANIKSIEDIKTGHILGSGCYSDVLEFLDLRGEPIGGRNEDSQVQLLPTTTNEKIKLSTKEGPKKSALKYVVKKLRCDLSSSHRNDGAIALATEARLLQKLFHPNIISMRCMGNNLGDADFFIIVERVDIDLSQQIHLWKEEEKRLGLSKSMSKAAKKDQFESNLFSRVDIAYEVNSALVYLHSNMVLFRDLKPQNIGLDKRNNVKIFDFGLSRELSDNIRVKNSTGYDKFILTRTAGTPRYMAPEVFTGITYGLPADIYSFSLVLWELMSLDTSFQNMRDVKDLCCQVHEKKRRPIINSNWPKEIKRILHSGWHHNASKRPDAIEICEELQLCMRHRVLSQNK